ncbi:MAG: bifunctional transaldolase/phosoglucose isomerase [Pyrinomonadaceae bacterium]|nr:bifunctional transaldolase/phosoglucose isomerase [Pyrinomonadaceae bacterium]
MTTSSFTFSLPENIDQAVTAEIAAWHSERKIARIWEKDAGVWTSSGEEKWLGWLDIVARELGDLERYRELRRDIEEAGFRDILLMGMGGSSLCPEVLAITFGRPNFHILDSTVPEQVKAVEEKLDLANTLFIVASKSGSTLEPNCFKQYFYERASDIVGRENAGKQFIAITDPGSRMEQVAKEDGFRHIFYGEPTVGGRFSALSPFGITAAAAMGLNVETVLRRAALTADECRIEDPANNPGAMLGLVLGVCHRLGRDKLTIITSPGIYDMGAWMEQLIAESTGKHGVAIIPVDREAKQPAVSYGDDRVFVYVKLAGSESAVDLAELHLCGHPVLQIEMPEIYDIGAEFFRWEFATAVAGAVMGINPFDQPDVESAKIEARKITDEYETTGELPAETPFFEEDGISLFSSETYAAKLMEMTDEPRLTEILSAHFANVEDGDYFAVLGYIEMNVSNEETLQRIRTHVLELRLAATCLGFGPRFLHSTGQAYKGGANNGVFLQITADDAVDLPVPGQKYTFGVVKAAQARGDFQVLLDRERRALRVHIKGPVDAGLEKLVNSLIVPVAI